MKRTAAVILSLAVIACTSRELTPAACGTDAECFALCIASNPPHPDAPDYACDGTHAAAPKP